MTTVKHFNTVDILWWETAPAEPAEGVGGAAYAAARDAYLVRLAAWKAGREAAARERAAQLSFELGEPVFFSMGHNRISFYTIEMLDAAEAARRIDDEWDV